MKYQRRAALVGAALLALAACGGDDSSTNETTVTTAPATDETTAPDGGDETTTTVAGGETPADDCVATEPGSYLNFGVYAPASSLDPLQNSGALVGGTDMLAIYDSLMRWDPDTNEWEPHLAESLTSNDDFTEWTLTLREGITYSNGDVMKAQDVLDNFSRMLGQGRNGSRGMIARVDLDNSTAADDTTVVFKLFQPWSNFGFLLADAPGMVVNPAVGNEVDASGTTIISTDATGAGVGPYTVERFAPGESPYLVLKARADYWGGAPCIETINLINIPSDRTKSESLELGELDVAFFRTQQVIDEARETGQYDEFSFLQSAGVVIFINQGVGSFDPVGQDVRFRQALAMAIDKEALSTRGYGSALKIQDGFMHEDSVWYTDGSPEVGYDPDQAKALVQELKDEGWDGSVRLICPDTTPDAPVALEAAWEAVGIDIETSITDTNTHIATYTVQKDFDLACTGLAFSDSALVRQIGFNFESDSPSNRIGYANPDMDAAIDELYAAPDDDARREVVAKISQIWAEDMPVIINGAVDEAIMFGDNVSGIMPTQQSMLLFQDATIER